MKKGQISLDLMLTVIAAILLGNVFMTFTGELTLSERTTGIRAQQENIANDLLELINQAKVFDETDSNYSINYKVPFIFDSDKRGGQDCNITLNRSTTPFIRISHYSTDLNEVAVQKDINFNFTATTSLNYFCGMTIDLNKEILGETT